MASERLYENSPLLALLGQGLIFRVVHLKVTNTCLCGLQQRRRFRTASVFHETFSKKLEKTVKQGFKKIMAAFKPHYTLCPLLGAHNLVGVSADKEESTILVTLGPNIIVKHKVYTTLNSCDIFCRCLNILIVALRPKATEKLEYTSIKPNYMQECL